MALVIYNPVGGDSTAKQFVQDHVLPLLKTSDVPIAKIVETEHAGHAGSAAFEFVDSTVSGPLDIIVASGDGTIHEIISTIALAPSYKNRSPGAPAQVNLVLVPCGTANALYSSLFPPKPNDEPVQYKLQGVHAFIKKSKRVPLTLAITDILTQPAGKGSSPVREKAIVSAVVTSTALHASILHDSEALRIEIPSIERFKVAAHQNLTTWYSGCAKLFPSKSTGVVEIWNPFDKEFVPHAESEEDDPYVDIDGPFSYFLSTVNVDRLEPAFQIAPLVTAVPRAGAFLDVVVIRPYRDASLSGLEAEEERKLFAEKSNAVWFGAYQGGDHINLRYDSTGKIVSEGEGELVVEYFRCGGWEWIPVSSSFSPRHGGSHSRPRTPRTRRLTFCVTMGSLVPYPKVERQKRWLLRQVGNPVSLYTCREGTLSVVVVVSRCLSGELASKELANNLCTLLVYFVDTGTTVDLNDLVLFDVMFDDRHGSLLVDVFEECISFG